MTEQGKCSECGATRRETDFYGVEILESGAARYEHAYCKKLTQCDSKKARTTVSEIQKYLDLLETQHVYCGAGKWRLAGRHKRRSGSEAFRQNQKSAAR